MTMMNENGNDEEVMKKKKWRNVKVWKVMKNEVNDNEMIMMKMKKW